jgi:hypothetical protein
VTLHSSTCAPHFLDLLDPGFRVDGPAIVAARVAGWRAESAVGPVILAYDDVVAVRRDRRLGSGLAHNLDISGSAKGRCASGGRT